MMFASSPPRTTSSSLLPDASMRRESGFANAMRLRVLRIDNVSKPDAEEFWGPCFIGGSFFAIKLIVARTRQHVRTMFVQPLIWRLQGSPDFWVVAGISRARNTGAQATPHAHVGRPHGVISKKEFCREKKSYVYGLLYSCL